MPAFRKVFAHSFSVVPVVKTSSTRRMRFSARSCGLRISNAFRRFRNRACRVNVVWGSVAAILTRFVAEDRAGQMTAELIGQQQRLVKFTRP